MLRRLRLATGLVMLAYVTMHLLNHAAGLISLGAMEQVLRWVVAFWSLFPMQVLFYGSFLIHYGLALWALWQRRSLNLRASEWGQLVLGFAIPLLLVRHVLATRLAHDWFDADTRYYSFILWYYFVRAPQRGLLQQLVLFVAWWHAMFGLHFWLRVRPWYGRIREPALVVAVLVPVVAWLGVVEAGREIIGLGQNPIWADMLPDLQRPSPQAAATIERIGDYLTGFFVAAVAAVLAARVIRAIWRRREGLIRISYPDGRSIDVVRGASVLEASRLAQIPHAAVCGGRGRCSTCRVRVRAAPDAVSEPGEAERRVLRRIRATASIRLACQLRPLGPVEVTPLLPPFAPSGDLRERVDIVHGREREIAVLFADIRGFTELAEGRLPYDVVFILNRYFAAMGRAVENAGGRVDKFLGDGVMALFGVEGEGSAACRQALEAARLMSLHLAELNRALQDELKWPLRIGIGIDAGPAIVGEMGYGDASAITAIGDAVNTASRLEELTKNYRCELVASETVVARAGLDRSLFRWDETEIRGKQHRLGLATLASAADLPPIEPAVPGERAEFALGSTGSPAGFRFPW